jgi:ATP-binding cassette, subfamily B, bacterial
MANRSFEEEALPEKLNFGIWGRIGTYALRQWPLLLILLVTMLFTTFYDSSFVPMMNKAAYSAAGSFLSNAGSATSIWDVNFSVHFIFGFDLNLSFKGYIILFSVMILVRSFAIFGTFFLTNLIGMEIMTDLRRDTFRRIQELSFSYFDKTSSGWLIARMQNDTSSIGDVLSWGIIQIFWAGFDLIFTLITMFFSNWQLSLVVLASIPLVAIIIPIFEKAILKAHRTARNAYSHFVGWLAESIDGAKTIKTLSIEDEVAQEADEITTDICKKRFHAGKINAFFQPILSIISSIMVAIVIVVGLNLRDQGIVDLALIVIFIGFVQSIYDPLQSLSETFSDFMATQAGAEKVMQLLDAKPAIVDSPEVIAKYGDLFHGKKEVYEPLEGTIDFENVSFHYDNGVEVIHPLNLHIAKGTSLAIVGETGSGKTTTVNLLCRFYQPTGGQIKIDGVDYLSRSVGWLRSAIGYVQQEPFVFTGTFKDNIRYGKPDASDAEIIAAAKMVDVHDFIMSQPKGYDTYLDDGGGNLSQGQKQLVSFARAIIRNPAILILDEATSSIDTETEAIVQKAIAVLLKGRTSIVIAHRLSTIVNSNRILVMDHGNVIEDGNHKTLMEKKGAYYNLYMNQFKDLSIQEQFDAYKSQIEDKKVKI